jgi:ParB family transcriptional regulator, chromosome partitioning protein
VAAKRDRLGKGLGALLGEYLGEQPAPESAPARNVPAASIAPNPFQPRREFSEDELSDLVSSIRENGLLQPLVVRPAPTGSAAQWELVAGERRWRSVLRLGWNEVPVVVRDVDDRTLLVLALVENLQRSQLSALEEAAGYSRLGEEFNLSQQQIAEAMGRDRSTVANSLRLLQLPSSVRQLLADGSLSAGHARALLGLGDDRRMADLAKRAAAEGWSVRELEAQVQRQRPGGKSRGKTAAAKPREAAERRLEEELQRTFGTAVKIKRARGGKGTIEVPFYGAEDFERIYELLTGTPAGDVV